MYNKEQDNMRCREYYNNHKEDRKLKLTKYNNRIVKCYCGKEMKQNNLYYHKKFKCKEIIDKE
jgi:hypothetical protein